MLYREEKMDLFKVNTGESKPYCLAHCISADFGMGAGIVVEFNKRWDMKRVLMDKYGNVEREFKETNGMCIPVEIKDSGHKTYAMNLITKQKVYWKPSYVAIRTALESLRDIMLRKKIDRVAMPLIGCGIDGKEWEKVSEIIMEVFFDTDIEVLICRR